MFDTPRPIIVQVWTSPTQSRVYNAEAVCVRVNKAKFAFSLMDDLAGPLTSCRKFHSEQAAAFYSHKNVVQFKTADAKLNRRLTTS